MYSMFIFVLLAQRAMGTKRLKRDFFRSQPAVSIINATKSYSKKSDVKPIIQNFNMTVEKGKIYSLLGSSGCGKTTLLSCVTGMKKLDFGDILVFGKTPGTRECGIPGRKIGFMPQELALHREFTIGEILQYYGRIYGLSKVDIIENTNFLISFLKLPEAERRINALSGGQQRRVSFAIALIHNPPLLILDEPTVGVDPLLRQSIWSHLVKLSRSSGTTVIITTHFIEEARDSNWIGLMRNGRLLTEDTPTALMKTFQTNILENIVVELCIRDTPEEKDETVESKNEIDKITIPKSNHGLVLSASSSLGNPNGNGGVQLQTPALSRWPSLAQVLHRAQEIEPTSRMNGYKIETMEKLHRLNALLYKNSMVLIRNFVFVFFLVFQPALQVFLLCKAVGVEPHGLYMGVINQEIGITNGRCDTPEKDVGCLMSSATKYKSIASCEFIRYIKTDMFSLVNYGNVSEALEDVKLGILYGIIIFPPNFTEQLKLHLT